MELFVTIVSDSQPLTIITKCSIFDVAAVLDASLIALVLFLTKSLSSLAKINQISLCEKKTDKKKPVVEYFHSKITV